SVNNNVRVPGPCPVPMPDLPEVLPRDSASIKRVFEQRRSGQGTGVEGTNDAAQAERRRELMDAAVGLAAHGGLKPPRIRAPAAAARPGFPPPPSSAPSPPKNPPLGAALPEHPSPRAHPDGPPPDGPTPAERVINLLRAPTDALTGAPQLAAAMLQAMTSGEP